MHAAGPRAQRRISERPHPAEAFGYVLELEQGGFQSVVGASMNVHGMPYLCETYSASARTPSVSVA